MLNDFDKHIRTIHKAVMLFGPLHNAVCPPMPNFIHLPLHPAPDGLRSPHYAQGGRIDLNFKSGVLTYSSATNGEHAFALAEYTQRGLFEALLAALRKDELSDFFDGVSGDALVAPMIERINADESKTVFLSLDEVNDDSQTLAYDLDVIGQYADLQYAVFTGVARFRGRLEGHMTPVVVWPEHFDLSTLWFRDADMDEHKAHLNFGFAPYTPGMLEEPYLYVYAYPYPDGFKEFDLPEPAYWNPDGFTGIVVKYDDLAKQGDVAAFVESLYLKLFALLRPVLG